MPINKLKSQWFGMDTALQRYDNGEFYRKKTKLTIGAFALLIIFGLSSHCFIVI